MHPILKGLCCNLIVTGCLGAGMAIAQETKGDQPSDKSGGMLPLITEKGYRCPQCHQVDGKLVGPSFREVSATRKGQRWAAEHMAYTISRGGGGEYGEEARMPHMPEVSEEDVPVIVTWILSLQ